MSDPVRTYGQIAAQNRREELILSHLPLVRHVVGKMLAQFPPNIDVENLESAGILGLVEAANNFDPGRGIQFKTFAYTRIRGAVLDELRRNSPLPQQMLERLARVRQAHKNLRPPVTVEALAAATGLSTDEVADCLAAYRLSRMLSLDRSAERIGTRLTDQQDQPDVQVEREDEKRLLAEALAALPERERLVVTLYYLEDLRLKEIGQVLELSESRVSRVLNAALFHLGEYMRAREKP
jgi:RNA polymerase sigma factor for flagellar operon FliA